MNNNIKEVNSIKEQIAMNSYSMSDLLFVEKFKNNNKYSFYLEDISREFSVKMMEYLKGEFNLDIIYEKEYSTYENYNINGDSYMGSLIYVDMSKKILVRVDGDIIEIMSMKLLSITIRERLQEIQFKGFEKKNENSIHILSYSSDRGMYFSDFKIDDRYLNLDINENYNDDFSEVHDSIVENLEETQIGLYLLHGLPGTGKTTYLRHLIRKVNKRLIFISPTMANQFSNPDMIPFLMKYPNSIIIIEDSENIIKKRENGGDQSVSNLLNLSDGILGDCLQFQIICTFNTNKEDIDDALLRKGRLIESYEFKELELDKTNNLLKNLGYKESKIPLSLSNIYNQDDTHFNIKKVKIGF